MAAVSCALPFAQGGILVLATKAGCTADLTPSDYKGPGPGGERRGLAEVREGGGDGYGNGYDEGI